MKKVKDNIYWNMNYAAKFKRTLWFIPVVIILCFLTPYFMGSSWLIYDILIGQLIYTYKKMKAEKQSVENKDKTN